MFLIDLAQLPALPIAGAPAPPVPASTLPPIPPWLPPMQSFLPLISCVEDIMLCPSIAIDGRFLFLADWDHGGMEGDPEHDLFAEQYEELADTWRGGFWETAVMPCWGHVKKFDFRPRPKDVKGNWRVWEEGAEAYLEE